MMNSIRPDQVSNRFIDENLQAEDALTSGNVAEAAKILLSITEKDPENWRAFNNLGILSWTRKNWQDAFVMFKKAVLLRPDYEDALINLFDAALKLKKVQEIQPLFDLALKMNPDLADVKVINNSIISLKDEIYLSKRALSIGFYSPIIEEAEKELETGNYYVAMEKFLKANDTEGPNAAAFCGLGIISFYQKRFQDAFTLFIESIKLNPSDPDIYLNLLDASKEIGKENAAIEIFNIYRAEFPELESIAKDFDS
jgi:tetratricopeptide (TPR) repeat protein